MPYKYRQYTYIYVNNVSTSLNNIDRVSTGVDNMSKGVDNMSKGVDNMFTYICGYWISLPYKCRQYTYIYVNNVSTSVSNVDRVSIGVDNMSTGVDNMSTGVDNMSTYICEYCISLPYKYRQYPINHFILAKIILTSKPDQNCEHHGFD